MFSMLCEQKGIQRMIYSKSDVLIVTSGLLQYSFSLDIEKVSVLLIAKYIQ